MKRTEKKLKSKGIKGHVFTRRLGVGYDRNYVANRFKDVAYLPFSRASRSEWDCRRNVRVFHYLNRWFDKQLGKPVDDVFHNFKNLGWKSVRDMYYYWDRYVRVEDRSWDYHADENGCLAPAQYKKQVY